MNLNFYAQKSVKIKIEVSFLSSAGIETGRVNLNIYFPHSMQQGRLFFVAGIIMMLVQGKTCFWEKYFFDQQ